MAAKKQWILQRLDAVGSDQLGAVCDLVDEIRKDTTVDWMVNDLDYLTPILRTLGDVDQRVNMYGTQDFRFVGVNGIFKVYEAFIARQTGRGLMSRLVFSILCDRWAKREMRHDSVTFHWYQLAQDKWKECLSKRHHGTSDWDFTVTLVLTLLFDPHSFVQYYNREYYKFRPRSRAELTALEHVHQDLSEMLRHFPWLNTALQLWCGARYSGYYDVADSRDTSFETFFTAAYNRQLDNGHQLLHHLADALDREPMALFLLVRAMERGVLHRAFGELGVEDFVKLCVRVIQVHWKVVNIRNWEFCTCHKVDAGYVALLLEHCERFWEILNETIVDRNVWSALTDEHKNAIRRAIVDAIGSVGAVNAHAWAFVHFLSSVLMPVWSEIGFQLLVQNDSPVMSELIELDGRVWAIAGALRPYPGDDQHLEAELRPLVMELMECTLELLFMTNSGTRALHAITKVIRKESVGHHWFSAVVEGQLVALMPRFSRRFWQQGLLTAVSGLIQHFCSEYIVLRDPVPLHGQYCGLKLLAKMLPFAVGQLSKSPLYVIHLVRWYCDLVHGMIDLFESDGDVDIVHRRMYHGVLWYEVCASLFSSGTCETRDSIWLKERLLVGNMGAVWLGLEYGIDDGTSDVDQEGQSELANVCGKCLDSACPGQDDLDLCPESQPKYLFTLEQYRSQHEAANS